METERAIKILETIYFHLYQYLSKEFEVAIHVAVISLKEKLSREKELL